MSDMQRSLTKVRFEHGFIPEIGMHRITSPDIPGFHVLGKTYGEAEREALAMVALIQSHWATGHRGKLSAVEFEAA